MGSIVVPVDDRLYATLKIGSDAFPFLLSHDDLSNFVQGFVNWHKQREIEISYILEGSVRVCLLREEHLLRAGDCFIILPDTLHSIQPASAESARYFTLIFNPCLLTGFPGSFFEQTWYSPIVAAVKGYHQIPLGAQLDGVRSRLFAIYDAPAALPDPLAIQRSLQDVWLLLARHVFPCATPAAPSAEEQRILEMINYLRGHYAEKFSLKRMSDHFHISRGECCRYFKRMMGMTLTDYLIDYRLSKATECLTTTKMSMTDIAHQTGFCSPSSFSAEFKKKTGCTPSEYRASTKQTGMPPAASSTK